MIYRDQLDRKIVIRSQPERIISLVPSQTELLADLGVGSRMVGITKFCIHPTAALKGKTIVGGTKTIDINTIKSLQPDLIIANKEENEQEAIETLEKLFPVWISDVRDRPSAVNMITSLGDVLGCSAEAIIMVETLQQAFQQLKMHPATRSLYLIWRKPWMAAGSDTFIHAMMKEMGLQNCITDHRYPCLSEHQLKQLNPQLILLSSEPFPFQQKHIQEIRSLLPDARVILVNGEMFSWYGSRMRLAPAYFNTLAL